MRFINFVKTSVILAGFVIISSCSNFSFGPNIGTSNISTFPQTQINPIGAVLPSANGQVIGSGNVRVALLLPLSGNLSNVGTSMANGTRLAMNYIEKNPNINNNISIILKDTKGDANIAANLAQQAVNEGASLVLGPLRGESVRAAGAITRSANIPLIGFSNTPSAASNGVYLLNVLPETEVKRSLSYARSLGKRSYVALTPASTFGQLQRNAFTKATTQLGLNVVNAHSFSNETEARIALQAIIPLIQSGQVDSLFIPDRSTAPSLAILLEAAGVDRNSLLIIGSADWENDLNISQTPYLLGAVFPAIDDAGQLALKPEYEAKFGTTPHPFATIAYTATLLANSSALAKSSPPYNKALLTNASGFNGRDGLFRFLANGKSEYALIMKAVIAGGAQKIDAPRLP